jgi:hypothetical protein
MAVDGFRFLDGPTRKLMRAWMDRDELRRTVPWTRMDKPLAEARVALISSAAVARRDDVPFDQEGERRDPWWGDPSFRVIPREVETEEVRVYHLHIDHRLAAKDLDCVLPLRRLDELVAAGDVGSSAPSHYSIMGYVLKTEVLVEETAPGMAAAMAEEEVDLALLVPV